MWRSTIWRRTATSSAPRPNAMACTARASSTWADRSRGPMTRSMRAGYRGVSGGCRGRVGSEEDAHERADLLEPHPCVRPPRRGVEVVDVQAHHRGHVRQGVPQYRRHPRGRHSPAPVLGGHPHALDLAGPVRRGADLRLEDDLAVLVEAREGTAGTHQFGDTGLVEEA